MQIWREGRTQDVTYPPDNVALFAVDTIADGMLFYTYDTRRQPSTRFHYLNQAECDGGECAILSLDGRPAWPPDEERTVVARGDGVLWLGNEPGRDADGGHARPVGGVAGQQAVCFSFNRTMA